MNTAIILLIVLNLGTGAALVKAHMDLDRVIEAARDLYYAAWWYPDRACGAFDLWTRLRDVCCFQPGEATRTLGKSRGPIYPEQKPGAWPQ